MMKRSYLGVPLAALAAAVGLLACAPDSTLTDSAKNGLVPGAEGSAGTNGLTVPMAVKSITVALGAAQIQVGTGTTATAAMMDGYGRPVTDRAPSWTSSNAAVATVGTDGTVRGVASGTASIVATSGGVSGSKVVTVVGIATQLTITSQPVSATSGVPLPSAVTVQVRDASGAAASSATSLVTASVASGSATLGGTMSVAAVNGVATFSGLQLAGSGSTTLRFSAAGLTAATSGAIVVAQAAAPAPPVTGEPVFSAATGTIVAQDNMDEYTTATAMGARGSTSLIKPHQSPVVDGVNPATGLDWPVLEPGQNSVVTGRGGTGKALRMTFVGQAGTAASYVLQTNMIQTPAASATHYLQYYGRINVLGSLVGVNAVRVKWFEAYHPDYGRIQWNTTDLGVGNHNKTFWGIHDQGFSEPVTGTTQPVGPYFYDLNDNQWHRYTYEFRSNTPNAGTVSINHTTLAATFSVSQAGVIHNGSILAFNTYYNGAPNSPYVVSNFDGSTHCTLTKLVNDGNAPPITADVTVPFSSQLDGVARMWIDGIKVVDVSQSAVGVTPAGGEKVWCTLTDIGTIAVGKTLNYLWWGGTQTTDTPAWNLDIDDFIWWTKP